MLLFTEFTRVTFFKQFIEAPDMQTGKGNGNKILKYKQSRGHRSENSRIAVPLFILYAIFKICYLVKEEPC